MKVFEFTYTACIYEGGSTTISIHKTKKGAEMALEFHKNESKREYDDMFVTDEDRTTYPFGEDERWDIIESDLLE